MVTYPLDEILLATLAGADKHGVAKAQTFRKVFRLLKPEVLHECFGAFVAPVQDVVRGGVAIDGKTLSGSKKSAA